MLDLLKKIKDNNVAVWVSDQKLKVSYGDQLPEENLLADIKNQREEIISFLSDKKIYSELAFDQLHVYDHTSESDK